MFWPLVWENMMKKKFLICGIICSLLIGCGQTTSVDNDTSDVEDNIAIKSDDNDAEILEDLEEKPEDVISDVDAPWCQAYLNYLNTDERITTDDHLLSFTLIYLDDDDIPELFIDTGVEAGGQLIATYYDGKVITQQFPHIGSKYIERSGLVYTDTGSMDYYPATITKLENGEFKEIASGVSYVAKEDWEKLNTEENYPYILTYEWEGQTVTEEQYRDKISEIFDLEKGIDPNKYYPDNCYSCRELISLLSTGRCN